MHQDARYVAGTEDQPTKQREGHPRGRRRPLHVRDRQVWRRRLPVVNNVPTRPRPHARQRDRYAGERAKDRHLDRLE